MNRRLHFAFAATGTGVLFPFHAFVTAVDYWQCLYPAHEVAFVIPVLHSSATLLILFLQMRFATRYYFTTQMWCSYAMQAVVMFLLPMLPKMISDVNLAYSLTLVLLCCTSVASSLQQGGLGAFGCLLGATFMQAVLSGEAIAGTLVSLLRCFTKLLGSQTAAGLARTSTMFFVINGFVMVACAAAFWWILTTPAADPYRSARSPKRLSVTDGLPMSLPSEVSLEPTGNEPAEVHRCSSRDDVCDDNFHSGGDRKPLRQDDDADDVAPVTQNHQRAPGSSDDDTTVAATNNSRGMTTIELTWALRFPVVVLVVNFVSSLCVFPGFVSRIPASTTLEDSSWFTVGLFLIFNVFDLLGRVVAGLPSIRGRTHYVTVTILVLRVVILTPIVFMMAEPIALIRSDVMAVVVMALFAGTNGLVASIVMMDGPQRLPPEERDPAGILLTFWLVIGLTVGSYSGLALQHIFPMTTEQAPPLCLQGR